MVSFNILLSQNHSFNCYHKGKGRLIFNLLQQLYLDDLKINYDEDYQFNYLDIYNCCGRYICKNRARKTESVLLSSQRRERVQWQYLLLSVSAVGVVGVVAPAA